MPLMPSVTVRTDVRDMLLGVAGPGYRALGYWAACNPVRT